MSKPREEVPLLLVSLWLLLLLIHVVLFNNKKGAVMRSVKNEAVFEIQ